MVLRGQIDAFILGGVIISWWAIREEHPLALGAGLMIMAIKPVNLLLTFALFLIAIGAWPRRLWLRVAPIPVIVLVVTTLIVGLDWPINYLINYRTQQPFDYLGITIWRGLNIVGLPWFPFTIVAILAITVFLRLAWRDGLNKRTLSIALATNLMFTSYANGNHYVMLIPAFLYVFEGNWRWGIVAYLATLTPFLRSVYGYNAAVLDLGYVMLLWIGAWMLPERPDISV
jgi:hypothetical protein